MAPRQRTSQPKKPGLHVWKIALPSDIAERIRNKADALKQPQNRVIINELAAYPQLEREQRKDELIQYAEQMLARYGARISGIDINEKLLAAVDAILQAAGPAALERAVEQLRVERREMVAVVEEADRRIKSKT